MPTENAPLGLYVHLPWCVSKCPYCDFNSHGLKGEALPEDAYVHALRSDLADEHRHALDGGWLRPLSSVFFGGGTPSLFSAAAIGAILDDAAARFGIERDAQITLEANPGAVEHGSFAALRAAGVNRVSLGAQSFDNAALARLGRIHNANEVETAMAALRRAGIDDVNIDLMYALEGQSVDAASEDLTRALALAPDHLSYYQLTLEPNTLFHHRPPPLPDADTAFEMHERGVAILAAAGFDQYEVSAYAPPGRASSHNINYWRFGDYLGIGAGAHGKLSAPDLSCVLRTAKTRHPKTYMADNGYGTHVRKLRSLSPSDLAFEYPLNVLRLKNEDLTLAGYSAATGRPGDDLEAALRQTCDRALMRERESGVFEKTELGWRFLNDVQTAFLADERKNQ